ncbi:enoyl-CoA hydratase/isomerase family protein [Acuticoccus kandeliae]|uniref:enoyl-CoA hydratase/isomerase family protein n=1 Tax=Acuticoccus kandeliae TaxID=2073160 RepID=UPI000D3E3EB9|nr:enoyl-CoA hydratase/isomerase family protein [Acuticoccus kandeliae]
MAEFILKEIVGPVGIITLNRPEVLNAWNAPMRTDLVATLQAMDADDAIRAIVLTGAGDRAFGAGQDLNETKTFDADRAEAWMAEWDALYSTIRGLSKPIVAALNGVAAGSAFQVALLCDLRVGHEGTTMGQPELKSGIASVTGPWIMREHIGLARTIDLTLTGRMMDAQECMAVGVLSRLVPKDKLMEETIALANELAKMPPNAMRLTRQRFREVTEPLFRDTLAAGVRIQREAYATGEPGRMMEQFLAERAARKAARGAA